MQKKKKKSKINSRNVNFRAFNLASIKPPSKPPWLRRHFQGLHADPAVTWYAGLSHPAGSRYVISAECNCQHHTAVPWQPAVLQRVIPPPPSATSRRFPGNSPPGPVFHPAAAGCQCLQTHNQILFFTLFKIIINEKKKQWRLTASQAKLVALVRQCLRTFPVWTVDDYRT